MSATWPWRCPTVLEYFQTLVGSDDDFALLEAAIALGQDAEPSLDVQAELARVDLLAERLRQRLPADASPTHCLRLLNAYFFKELGFGGNVNDYYSADNSYLHRVLETRRGIPISLAVVYMSLAEAVGLQAHGVSFPGHFLVKVRLQAGEVIVDPFTGQSLSRQALDERLEPFRQQHGLVGDFDTPLGLFLQAASSRDILVRMLRNLQLVHRQTGQLDRLLAVQERLVRLLPEQWEERRDRALVLADLGLFERAVADMGSYLEARPDAADAARMAAHVNDWRAQPGSRLH